MNKKLTYGILFLIAVIEYASIASFGGGNMLDHTFKLGGGLIALCLLSWLFSLPVSIGATGIRKFKAFSITMLILVAIQLPWNEISITSERLLLGLILGLALGLFFSAVVFMNKKNG